METENKALLEELRAAQEEHERALQAANQTCLTLDRAREEYDAARAAEKAEDELAKAAETLARGLQNLEVDGDTAELQATVPRIMDSLVEYHANIGCYQCYLFLDHHKLGNTKKETYDVSKLHVRVEFPRVELTHKNQSNGHVEYNAEIVWWTEIERNVDASLCSVEDKEDHWYLRLPIRPSDKQPLGGFSSFTQVSSTELHPDSYASVCCRGCNTQLLGSTRIEKVLPLPSANWMDMFDFWGAGIGAFEHIPRDDIYAQQHRVLVGESYVLLHANDFVMDATVTDNEDAKEESEWVPLTCAACSERVGLRYAEQPDTIRLHKHLISARKHLESSTDKEENVFAKYTIDSLLSAKLLEMADAEGKFRFILTPGDSHEHDFKECSHSRHATGDDSSKKLQLQLLSWETMIKQQDATQFRRVLRVLYGAPLPGLLPSHEVSLPPAMYSAIAQRLETSSTLLPSSLRIFNRMNVGYLFA